MGFEFIAFNFIITIKMNIEDNNQFKFHEHDNDFEDKVKLNNHKMIETKKDNAVSSKKQNFNTKNDTLDISDNYSS